MSRHSTATDTDLGTGLDEFVDLDVPSEDPDTDLPQAVEGESDAEELTKEGGSAKAATKKEPSRGDLPEGYVTPTGLSKILTERGLGTKNPDGTAKEVSSQMVYSYAKNSKKGDNPKNPFPDEIVKDSLGNDRLAVKIEAGVAWWEAKNSRVAERAANAKAKADKAAANKANANAEQSEVVEAEGETSNEPVVEAE